MDRQKHREVHGVEEIVVELIKLLQETNSVGVNAREGSYLV